MKSLMRMPMRQLWEELTDANEELERERRERERAERKAQQKAKGRRHHHKRR